MKHGDGLVEVWDLLPYAVQLRVNVSRVAQLNGLGSKPMNSGANGDQPTAR